MSGELSLNGSIEGDKGGGKGGIVPAVSTPREAPNTLTSNTVARVLDVISEGEIEGLVDGLKSVYFNDTVLQNADDSFNFSGVNISTREGTLSQTFIPGFPSVETEVAVGTEVLLATPVVRTITDVNVTAVSVKIRIPGLTKQSTNGDLNGSSVQFKIELQSDGGGFGTIRTETISGKTTSPYEVAYRVSLPEGGNPWDIRVSRLSADSDDDATQNNKTFWSTYTRIIDNKLSYEGTSLIGVEIDAKQFSEQVPSRGYLIKGLKIQIPSNYDPLTRIYTGLWDGSFITAWTDNPAWVLYDLLTNVRYGIGASIVASQVDKFALFEIAQYCDELVPDGTGKTEPRYTFNGVIATREEAFKVLFSIASSFRGMIYWSSGLVTVVTDKDEDPVQLVSPANVIDGVINYSGPSLKTKHSVVLVRWNDPEDGYRSSIAAVEDPELIATLGWKAKEIVAFGCTSKGQALRVGKWFIDTEKNGTDIANYRASFDNADLVPGAIIAIADPSFAGVRFGGRVISSTLSQVTVDGTGVTLAVGETFTVSAHLPSGEVEERDITNTSDGLLHTVLDVSSPFSFAPTSGSMWVVTGTNVAPRKFRVVAMSEIEKNIYEVTALIHDPSKYARIEQDINIDEGVFTLLPTGPLKSPLDITIQEYLYEAANGRVQGAVSVSWTAPSDPRNSFYQVEVMRPDTDFWDALSTPTLPNLDILSISPGTYQFRVRSADTLGQFSDFTTESFNLLGLVAPPSDVPTFRINNVGPQSNLTWTQVSDLDISHYKIKFSSKTAGAKWAEATTLVERVPSGAGYYTVPTLIGTYFIKAVDSSDVESLNATSIISNIGDVSQDNIVVIIAEAPEFSGVKTNVELDGSSIKLTDLTTTGTYFFSQGLDLGGVFTSRVIPTITVLGSDVSNTMDTWLTLDSITAMSTADPEDWDVTIEIRTTNDAPWYGDGNFITNAEVFDNASWTKGQSTILVNDLDSPNGTLTADVLVEDATSSSAHDILDDISEVPSTEKVFSVWVKADGRDHIRLSIADAAATSNSVTAVFDVSAGTADTPVANGNGTGEVATIVSYGNGWYKCILSGVPNTSGSDTRVRIELGSDESTFSYNGDNSSGVDLWGAELLDGGTANTPTWGSWDEIIIGDYTARAFGFRTILTSFNENTTPLISALGVTIDMPDRVERGDDVETDSGSNNSVKVITYTSEFKVKPTLGVTPQDMSTGDIYTLSAMTATGFTITFTDSGATGIQRTFDWTTSGYGRKQ